MTSLENYLREQYQQDKQQLKQTLDVIHQIGPIFVKFYGEVALDKAGVLRTWPYQVVNGAFPPIERFSDSTHSMILFVLDAILQGTGESISNPNARPVLCPSILRVPELRVKRLANVVRDAKLTMIKRLLASSGSLVSSATFGKNDPFTLTWLADLSLQGAGNARGHVLAGLGGGGAVVSRTIAAKTAIAQRHHWYGVPNGIRALVKTVRRRTRNFFCYLSTCDMQPGLTETKSLKFYVVDCLPNFNHMPEDVIRHLPLGQTIIINAPLSLRNQVMAAAHAWQTALANQGILIDVIDGVCGPLQGAGCVIVEERTVPNEPTKCAAFGAPYNTQTGEINGNSHLYVPDWYDEYQERLPSLLAHELGHAFGLDHTHCDLDDSVMWTPENEDINNCRVLPPGAASGPTASDAIAAASTPYGTGARSVCPAQ